MKLIWDFECGSRLFIEFTGPGDKLEAIEMAHKLLDTKEAEIKALRQGSVSLVMESLKKAIQANPQQDVWEPGPVKKDAFEEGREIVFKFKGQEGTRRARYSSKWEAWYDPEDKTALPMLYLSRQMTEDVEIWRYSSPE